MKISYTSFSEKGGRMNNEDCRNVVNIGDERKMFIVCDGMGGHALVRLQVRPCVIPSLHIGKHIHKRRMEAARFTGLLKRLKRRWMRNLESIRWVQQW